MPITYRDPDDFNEYQHTLPVCLFKVASSDSHPAPYPTLVNESMVVAGGGLAAWFHDCYSQVRTTRMMWDKGRGCFRKDSSIRPYHNVVFDPFAEPRSVSWKGESLWQNLFPPEDPDNQTWWRDDPYVEWEPHTAYLTTAAPFSDWGKSVVTTHGDHSRTCVVASANGTNLGPSQGPGFVFSIWPEKPLPAPNCKQANEVHYSSSEANPPPCSMCGWDDIPWDAPHLCIEFGGSIRIFVVFPYTVIDDDGVEENETVPGFVRTSWNLRAQAQVAKEFEIGRSELVLMNQKDALKAWPRMDISITQLANAFSVVFEEAFGEAKGKARRGSEITSHTHSLEPWSVLTNVASASMTGPPVSIRGNEFSTDPRSVIVPGEAYIGLHSRLTNYALSIGKLRYSHGARLQGVLPWNNQRTDIDTWASRAVVIGALQREPSSSDPNVAPYVPSTDLSFEWETKGGKKTGNVAWQMDLSTQPRKWREANPWVEDWVCAVQGFFVVPDTYWTEPGNITYRDYGQVVERVTVDGGERRGPSVVDAVVRIPLHHLEDHPTLGPVWRDEIVDFAPVEVWLGWIANTRGAGAYDPAQGNMEADLAPRLSGYIYSVDVDAPGEGIERYVTVICRDELMRTQKPAGGIDTTWPPLDLLPGLISPVTGEAYGSACMGYDAVQWLLQRCLGNAYDAEHHPYGRYVYTSGFYDGHQQFMGHLPIVRGNATSPTGSMQWPAPYGRDVWAWLDKIADYDAAMLFWKPYELDASAGSWLSSIQYANWQYHLYRETHRTFNLYPMIDASTEATYLTTWNNRIIRESDKRRPQEAVNRVCVQAEREGCPWPYQEWVATDWRSIGDRENAGERWFGGVMNTAFVRLPSALAMGTHGHHPGETTCWMLAQMLFTRSNSQMDVTVPGQPYSWWADLCYIQTTDPVRAPETALPYRVIRFHDEAVFKEPHLTYTTRFTLSEEPAYHGG